MVLLYAYLPIMYIKGEFIYLCVLLVYNKLILKITKLNDFIPLLYNNHEFLILHTWTWIFLEEVIQSKDVM
jgi:hypothetical protein